MVGGLKDISAKVSSNQYNSEYEFEVAVAGLMQQAHEGHLSVPLPAYSTFGFIAPWEFVSYSSDGIQLPQVYVESRLFLLGHNSRYSDKRFQVIE